MLKLIFKASFTFSMISKFNFPTFSLSLDLSKVLICSTKIIESFWSPNFSFGIGMCVGNNGFFFFVFGTAITVGEN